MKRDLQINFQEIENIADKFSTYKTALEEMEQSLEKIIAKSTVMRVDRNDIWWNMQDIIGACNDVLFAAMSVSTYGIQYKFWFDPGKDAEEIQRERNNYSKLTEIKNYVSQYGQKPIDENVPDIKAIHENKVIPFENLDDEFASEAKTLYNTCTNDEEWLDDFDNDVFNAVFNFCKGILIALKDLVVGIVKLVVDVVVFAVDAIVVGVCAALDLDAPDWAQEGFDSGVNTVKAILEDPYIIVEDISQSVSDAFEEEGIAYCAGYAVGSIVGAKGIDNADDIAKLGLYNVDSSVKFGNWEL